MGDWVCSWLRSGCVVPLRQELLEAEAAPVTPILTLALWQELLEAEAAPVKP